MAIYYKDAELFRKAVASSRSGRPLSLSLQGSGVDETNSADASSFRYDPLGYPLKSTQQVNVDWSKFENHCFFSSAEVAVNDCFDKIINYYPFDGSRREYESFYDKLSGFEKWVIEQFPQWAGALHFSGTLTTETPANGYTEKLGTHIVVKDKSGVLSPDLAKTNLGTTVINPSSDKSFSVESLIFVPAQSNDTQVIFQKQASSTNGMTFFLSSSTSTEFAGACFAIYSGSLRNFVTGTLLKGAFNHVCVTFNREEDKNSLEFYRNESLVSSSTSNKFFDKLEIDDADFVIGSGSSFYCADTLVMPKQTLSGTIDEFRVFHSRRTLEQQALYASRGLYSSPDLKLYFRFNEPSGSLTQNDNATIESIVLDSSGNSLHANVSNYTAALRTDMSGSRLNLMTNESADHKVILFPAFSSVTSLNTRLLSSASLYDKNNPNIILRLIPQHYLLEGMTRDGFSTIEGNGGQSFTGQGPRSGEKGSVQIVLTFLYMWSKFFDEVKVFADSFKTLNAVDYDTNETVPDNFLNYLMTSQGFQMPALFTNADALQMSDGRNVVGHDDVTPIKRIQTHILRKILVNLPDVVKSKGTQHSIKSFLRAVGIDPDNSLKIREYGGPRVAKIGNFRETRIENIPLVNFTGSCLVSTLPLSASRVEPGFPSPAGSFYTNALGKIAGTNNSSDGLLTSGSWHVEGVFKFPPQNTSKITDANGNQSLIRLHTTGTFSSVEPALVLNLVASQKSINPLVTPKVTAMFRPGASTSSPLLQLEVALSGSGIFDGDRWNVSFGCTRNDAIGSTVSSSYYLRVGKLLAGDLIESYVTSSFFKETASSEDNVLRKVSSTHNASGAILSIGGGQTFAGAIGYPFLNGTSVVSDTGRTTDYEGWACNLRFWSKSMSQGEWREHVFHPKSLGVDDPSVNYNFVTTQSGSFQKLRLDVLQKQPNSASSEAGSISFLDFSQNRMTATGSNFPITSSVFLGDTFVYSYLSPRFDDSSTDDKIRIRSFQSSQLVDEHPDAVLAPSYLSNDIFANEEPQDDLRLSIEFSLVDSLNKDIMGMFSSLDAVNDYLGKPEDMFALDYPDLDRIRDVYFNRLSDKPDFKSFLEFYKWFDVSVSSFISQLIPSTTHYKGTNFVVESHVLERHKNTYRHAGNYVGVQHTIDDHLLVQQIVGKLKKY